MQLKKILFYLLLSFFICSFACANNDEKEALKYTFKALDHEYKFDSHVKKINKKAQKFIADNFFEYGSEIPTFIIGTTSQILMKKPLKFKGKTSLIGEKYEITLNQNTIALKIEGKAPEIADNCKYWLLSGNKQLGAGLYFVF